MKNILIRIIVGLIPGKKARRYLRNCLTVGFGKTRNHGKNNKIVFVDVHGHRHFMRRLPGCNINFHGDNNYIEIQGDLTHIQIDIRMDGNSRVLIQNSHIMSDKIFRVRGMENCVLDIGDGLLAGGSFDIVFSANTKITIGTDCMIADSVYIRTGDGHSLLSMDGKILNHNADVVIGNHVWIAYGVCILKGTNIPDNCVVGARSLVNKKFSDENVLIAGVPARVIKSNINWDRQSVM